MALLQNYCKEFTKKKTRLAYQKKNLLGNSHFFKNVSAYFI